MSFNLAIKQDGAPFIGALAEGNPFSIANFDPRAALLNYAFASDDGSDFDVSLPPIGSYRGRILKLAVIDTTDATVFTPDGAETINGGANYTIAAAAANGASVILYAPPTGTDWFIVATFF